MASYLNRLTEDLDRWIAKGLVPAESRSAILADVGGGTKLDAAQALGVVAALLFAGAVIAFVGANWSDIPRLVRFGLVLGLFLGVCATAAWAVPRRPNATNALLTLAGLVFAAAIGLTGQIFDIAGDPRTALHFAGLAAGLLALAGRAPGPAAAALALIGLGDVVEMRGFSFPWLCVFAPLGLGLAWAWRSKTVTHLACVGAMLAACLLILQNRIDGPWVWFAVSALFTAAGLAARQLRAASRRGASEAYGWFVAFALATFAIAGFEIEGGGAWVHRGGWLVLSGGVVALGRAERHVMISAAGVIGLLVAVGAVLFDLGLKLLTASAVFALAALAMLAAGVILRRAAR